MGVSLAKHLIALLETKPGLKILILRDIYNHFGHEERMMPVYNFMLAYSLKNPDKMIILPSYIDAHPTGLPPFMDGIMSDNFIKKSGIQKHLSLYARAVSDHSKTMVIDGKSKNPVAFVGSKNWTDAAGSIVFDEVIKLEDLQQL